MAAVLAANDVRGGDGALRLAGFQGKNPDRLVQLDISETELDDAAMQQVSRMTNLESLILDGTRITDAGIVHLQKLAKLKVLLLSHTKVTPTRTRELQKALPNAIIFGP